MQSLERSSLCKQGRLMMNFFDVMMTSAFMKADMEWDWQKVKKVLTHMKELKDPITWEFHRGIHPKGPRTGNGV